MPDRKAASLKAVLDIARAEFSSKPFDQVSIGQIATAAHCSISTIYDVYENKHGLYVAATEAHVLGIWQKLAASATGDSAFEQFINLMEARAETFSQHNFRGAFRNLVTEIGGSDLISAPKLRKSIIEQYEQFMDLVARCAAEGVFRDLPARVMGEVILAHLDWRPLYHSLCFGSDAPLNIPPREIVRRGLLSFLSDKGLKAYERLRPNP
ncbi:MAG TPA: hypothetical protein DCL54_05475 [Alphaproteobacteria bacterium]|nr:hypothetical protein [Alphaproteobacteria bacterium]